MTARFKTELREAICTKCEHHHRFGIEMGVSQVVCKKVMYEPEWYDEPPSAIKPDPRILKVPVSCDYSLEYLMIRDCQ